MTLREAAEIFLRDGQSRQLSTARRRTHSLALRQIKQFAAEQGIEDLDALDRAALREWRDGWQCSPGTHNVRLAAVKQFFRFAVSEAWIEESPAETLRPVKARARPTMPLSKDEVLRLLAAAPEKERALLLLMRFSGLAIQDASTLSNSAVDGQQLTLRRAKSGELVVCELPPVAARALEAARNGGKHFFWTGRSKPSTAAKYWAARLRKVAADAAVAEFRTHRLRDTFAVSLLTAGVSMDDVSTLLGHSSVRTTERYYAPWDKSRRERLAAVVRDAHRRDPTLSALDRAKGPSAGGVQTTPRNGPSQDCR